MSKIIIKNQTEMDDISVLTLVQRVIKNGRIVRVRKDGSVKADLGPYKTQQTKAKK